MTKVLHINHDPVMIAYAFEWGKLLKCLLKKNVCRISAMGLKIDDSENILDPMDSYAPTLGQYTCILS